MIFFLCVCVTVCGSRDVNVGGLTHHFDPTMSMIVVKLCQTFMFPLRMNQDDFGDHTSLFFFLFFISLIL